MMSNVTNMNYIQKNVWYQHFDRRWMQHINNIESVCQTTCLAESKHTTTDTKIRVGDCLEKRLSSLLAKPLAAYVCPLLRRRSMPPSFWKAHWFKHQNSVGATHCSRRVTKAQARTHTTTISLTLDIYLLKDKRRHTHTEPLE